MGSQNVSAIHSPDNASLEGALTWFAQKAESGRLARNTAHNYASAVRALESVLEPDEPRTARFVHDNVDELAARHARKFTDTSSSGVYGQRAKAGLGHFLAFLRDPAGWKGPSRVGKQRKPGSRSADPATVGRAAVNCKSGVSGRAQTAAGDADDGTFRGRRTFPLDEKRDIAFRLPERFTTDDVVRFACHLVTLATDFRPEHLRRMSLALAERPHD